jgi:hypothetical protein
MSESNVCQDQHKFNDAFYKALKHADKKVTPKPIVLYVVIHIIFLVAAIMIATATQPKENRLIHYTLAIMFAPVYVLAYILNRIIQ